MKPLQFTLKRDRKNGLVVTSPAINWNKLSEEEKLTQWSYCKNTLWMLEKDGVLSKEDFYNSFYTLLSKIGFNDDIPKIKKLKDWEISYSLLSTGYLISIGCKSKQAVKYFVSSVKKLVDKPIEEKETIIKRDLNRKHAGKVIGEIQDLEDDIFNQKVNFTEWLKDKNLSKESIKIVHSFFLPRLKELILLMDKKDEQLMEAYEHLTDKQISYMVLWYGKLLKALDSLSVVETVPVVRKSKAKTPDKIVKKLKYKTIDPDLNISSVLPQKIIGSNLVWTYNTKTRKLSMINCSADKKISVYGTYLINYDETSSVSKTLRKPKEQLQEFLNGGKVHMKDYFNKIKTVGSVFSGKITKDTVLLKAF